ncbi:glycerol-3-phosphate 1-O-acyltransferase PlsY [Tumebacillus sp. DT12]|uniref:Glycerol-3-phosphate acyltransferase n=1 Tax=Tumebacillus lacus TaxID=2995335 RepID=A0ABT3WYW2_9BACL|nr:glycerol-3-phosphate 1-O-acyltransferase PlsY [Tumebacillus lacus]MCX7568947.1 glycerol-3-phosphate 1-O-acyltransferase PlsY [Tumebacillus lacus]
MAAILIGYLLGSISFSMIIGRYFAGIDIRDHGSGNAGATNTLRVLGPKWAATVLLLDLMKGVFAVLIARWIGATDTFVVLTGVAVIAGHNWPLFFNFRGGKGVATTIGVMFSLLPLEATAAAIIGLIVLAFTRYVSLGSMVFATLIPLLIVLAETMFDWEISRAYLVFSVVAAVMTIWRHRANIGRIAKGNESKLGAKRQGQQPSPRA